MRSIFLLISVVFSLSTFAQVDFKSAFQDCNVTGSITVYDYQTKKWIFSDSADAKMETLPASTFKIINLLIALQTGVIKDENEVVKWPGHIDTTLYGYRPETYKDMTVKQAFEVSAGWVFIELAKRIGEKRYRHYLNLCNYGNNKLSGEGTDFWNFGGFSISPMNQVEFLIRVYEEKVPFSRRNLEILKRVMITENTLDYKLRSKTGWTRKDGNDIGWWVGYVECKDNVYFFATRIIKDQKIVNPRFGQCRKDITKNVLKQLRAVD
jgi:beta-lactamase class D